MRQEEHAFVAVLDAARNSSAHPDYVAVAGSAMSRRYYDLCLKLADRFTQRPRGSWKCFAIACLRLAQKMVVVDAFIDQPEAASVMLEVDDGRDVLIQRSRLGLLTQLFDAEIYPSLFRAVGDDTAFWNCYRKHLWAYADNCERELKLRTLREITLSDADDVSHDRSRMLLVIADYICHVAGPQYREALYASFRFYNAAEHLIDDIQDLREDVRRQTPTTAIIRIAGAMPRDTSAGGAVVLKGLANGSITQMLSDAQSLCGRSAQCAGATRLPLEPWIEHVHRTRLSAELLMEKYDDLARAVVIRSQRGLSDQEGVACG